MDYKREIIKLLFRADKRRIKLIYYYVTALLADTPEHVNEAKKAA